MTYLKFTHDIEWKEYLPMQTFSQKYIATEFWNIWKYKYLERAAKYAMWINLFNVFIIVLFQKNN